MIHSVSFDALKKSLEQFQEISSYCRVQGLLRDYSNRITAGDAFDDFLDLNGLNGFSFHPLRIEVVIIFSLYTSFIVVK